jgi:hypothetical protein
MGSRGPAPDPNAIRRDRPSDQATWTELPTRRDGAPPEWPAYLGEPVEGSMRATLWAELWSMPQAVMWERNRQVIEVAQHVETLVAIQMGPPEGMKSDPTPTLRGLALRQMDALGLTAPALNRLRWRIAGSTDTQQETKRAGSNRRPAAKDRFAVIEGRRTA